MSKKQMLALKVSAERETQTENKEMQARYLDGLENYQKLRQIFPWLAEENDSYL